MYNPKNYVIPTRFSSDYFAQLIYFHDTIFNRDENLSFSSGCGGCSEQH